MNREITFSIIKPDAMSRGYAGKIIARITDAGFQLAALRMIRLTLKQAEAFYEVHREKSFYSGLVAFMSSGPVIVMVLRHENAVKEFRNLLGSTNPKEAASGTLRADFATSVQENAVHGSDSPENALREASFFFPAIEIY